MVNSSRQDIDEELKDAIKKVALTHKIDVRLINDSKKIEESINNICYVLNILPEDKDLKEAERYAKKNKL